MRPIEPTIIDFYTSAYDEASRLVSKAHGRLEFLRTQELLRRHLPPAPARVLDVGGGPSWPVLKGIEAHTGRPLADSPLLESALIAARIAESDPALLVANAHILAIGRAPGT